MNKVFCCKGNCISKASEASVHNQTWHSSELSDVCYLMLPFRASGNFTGVCSGRYVARSVLMSLAVAICCTMTTLASWRYSMECLWFSTFV